MRVRITECSFLNDPVSAEGSDISPEPLKDIRGDQEQDAVKQEYGTAGHKKQYDIDHCKYQEYLFDR